VGRGGPCGPAAIPPLPVPDAWQQVGIDPDGAVFVPPGVALDLGATGKAFAADLIARSVPATAGTDFVISLGGDVAVGLVEPGADRDWPIIVTEQVEDAGDADAETVTISSGAIATSSVTRRRWKYGGRVVHHLLDPRTGAPAARIWRTATVAAASCVAANTASTVSIVLGEQAPPWLAERGLAARLVGVDGRVVRLGGWPEGDTCSTSSSPSGRPRTTRCTQD
jgi:FAD:protein FMN transferase